LNDKTSNDEMLNDVTLPMTVDQVARTYGGASSVRSANRTLGSASRHRTSRAPLKGLRSSDRIARFASGLGRSGLNGRRLLNEPLNDHELPNLVNRHSRVSTRIGAVIEIAVARIAIEVIAAIASVIEEEIVKQCGTGKCRTCPRSPRSVVFDLAPSIDARWFERPCEP
jgi:hypothetical protein